MKVKHNQKIVSTKYLLGNINYIRTCIKPLMFKDVTEVFIVKECK